jgi:hypothetical protein
VTSLDHLKLNQTSLISDWFLQKSPYPTGTPATQIAADATNALGFNVTEFDIKSAADAVGVGGLWLWDANPSAADNTGTVIEPPADSDIKLLGRTTPNFGVDVSSED